MAKKESKCDGRTLTGKDKRPWLLSRRIAAPSSRHMAKLLNSLLIVAILCTCAMEYMLVAMRLTAVDDLKQGTGMTISFGDTDAPNAWGKESLLQFARRRLRQQFAEIRPVELIAIHGHKHPVDQLTPVRLFPELRKLWISRTAVTDLSPLTHCRNLTELRCSHTYIRDFSVLERLTSLEYLDLRDCEILDLGALNSLIALRTLRLDDTRIDSLAPLSKLTNLTVLSLNGTAIQDWRPIARFTNLRNLSLENTQIPDMPDLEHFENLRSLNLRNAPVASLSSLGHRSRLEVLDIRHTNINDLALLDDFPSLVELHVDLPGKSDATMKRSLSHLAKLEHLRVLELGVAAPVDWERMQALVDLRTLKLCGPISEIPGIDKLPGLEVLDLRETYVSYETIDVTNSLPNLRELVLNSYIVVHSHDMSNECRSIGCYLETTLGLPPGIQKRRVAKTPDSE